MEGTAGPFLGADVDALEKLASQMKRATELAQNLVSSLTNMINELNFFGHFGEEFASLIIGVTAPLITKILGSLTKVGDDLHIAAQKQKQVSDGTGKPTPAGVDKGTAKPPEPAPPASAGAAAKPEYKTLNGVQIHNAGTQARVNKMADEYYKATGHRLTVTDGDRTAEEQANAMANILENPKNKKKLSVYVDHQAAHDIQHAYEQAKAEGKSPAERREAMVGVIKDQMKHGTYISKHLRNGAVDIRSSDMGPQEVTAFRKAAADAGFKVLDERDKADNHHWHLQTIPPKK
jgi:hypothetical protein